MHNTNTLTNTLVLTALEEVDRSACFPRASAEVEATLAGLFDEFHSRLLHYVLTFGLDLPDSEDVVQETFLSLFRHLSLGRSRVNLRGWLFRVAHNLALRKRRSHRTSLLLSSPVTSPCTSTSASEGGSVLDRQPAPGHDPEKEFAFNQLHRKLRAIFSVLPQQERSCLHLRAEGLTYRDIAGVLGISLGAVSLSLSRALGRMARATESR